MIQKSLSANEPFLLILTFPRKTNKCAGIYYHISTSTSKQGAMGCVLFIKQEGAAHIKHT